MSKRTYSVTDQNFNKHRLSSAQARAFLRKIYRYFDKNGRLLPWRRNINPYRVLVSEMMLQQTQVERVIDKYEEFLTAFPHFIALAEAHMPELLKVWSGLGYNRRALALRALAQRVISEHQGRLPSDLQKLLALPGIGRYTAGAIRAFAFNKPGVFMDTNIRRVYIHEFFSGRMNIHDHEIIPYIEQTMDLANPRKWYNALMDYGTMLKQRCVNPNRKSAHYTRKSTFKNSNRQVRGKVLTVLLKDPLLTMAGVIQKTGMDPERVKHCVGQLIGEGFIHTKGRYFSL